MCFVTRYRYLDISWIMENPESIWKKNKIIVGSLNYHALVDLLKIVFVIEGTVQ